ncbi:MAG: MarR family transcriptional regulator, partial [Sphingomonas sp.]
IYLTDKARPLIEQLRVVADGLFEDALDGLAGADRAVLFDALTRIHANLNDIPEHDEARHG